MYDPTIFDNLKVAFENRVYDLDTISQRIHIKNRVDRMDFAVMAREFAVQFVLADKQNVSAEIVLHASLEDLSGEILEIPHKNVGCTLSLRFNKDIEVEKVSQKCSAIEDILKRVWEDENELTQTLSFVFKQNPTNYLNTIEMKFNQKIDEEVMGDIPEFLENVIVSLEGLNKI